MVLKFVTIGTMAFKLVRTDSAESRKIQLPVGDHLIGRGKFLDCDDKRVSRSHGKLEVSDGSVTIKSVHQNPCFIIKKGSGDMQIIRQDLPIELSHGDRFGLLLDCFWFELLHCSVSDVNADTQLISHEMEQPMPETERLPETELLSETVWLPKAELQSETELLSGTELSNKSDEEMITDNNDSQPINFKMQKSFDDGRESPSLIAHLESPTNNVPVKEEPESPEATRCQEEQPDKIPTKRSHGVDNHSQDKDKKVKTEPVVEDEPDNDQKSSSKDNRSKNPPVSARSSTQPLERFMNGAICNSDVMETIEVLDSDQEEAGDPIATTAPGHVNLVGELRGQGMSSQKPSTSAEYAVIPQVDVRPSTSSVKVASHSRLSDGSILDSDFDDELTVSSNVENTTIAGLQNDIPDDEELDEPIRNIISNVERGIDDAADRLLGMSSSFTWVEGFESFKSVPEEFSGPTPGPVKDYDSVYDAFTDIWDKSIIDVIVRETNRYAKLTIGALKDKRKLMPSSRMHGWTDTNADEILLLFGVMMYMAIDPRTSQNEYWTSGVLSMPKFRQLMPFNRYVLLMKFLHFVDNSDVSHNLPQPQETSSTESVLSKKLFLLSPIIKHLGEKFKSLYNLERNISIDATLTLFKGRLSWVQTIRSKAARFGIKSYELCESRTGYMARFQVYTGKSDVSYNDTALSADLGGKTTKVVLELLEGLDRRGHCVTMDNFYNCPALARYLKSSLGFDCLGTLRANRRNVPSDIAKVPENVPKGTIIARQCGDISIVTWKDSKLVNIISTFHDDSTYVGSKAGKRLVKPVCVRDYNSTMGGVDLKDQKLSMYLLERKRGVKWYVKMFRRLLNVSIHNSFIMYVSSMKRRNKSTITHREFRYQLADSLVKQHRSCPQENREVTGGDLLRMNRNITHVPKFLHGTNRKRCEICLRMKIHKKVRTQCVTCDVFMCFESCWEKWHSYKVLPGHEIRGRKRALPS